MKDEHHAKRDLEKLGELIDGIEVAMLTTHALDGSLVTRPLQTLKFDAGGELIFLTAASSRKVAELAADPDVNIAYSSPERGCHVSVRGRAHIDRDQATIDELWSPVQRVFFPQGKDDPDLAVLRVRVRDAAYWEPAGNFAEQALDFLQGMVSDEPEDLGRHGRLSG